MLKTLLQKSSLRRSAMFIVLSGRTNPHSFRSAMFGWRNVFILRHCFAFWCVDPLLPGHGTPKGVPTLDRSRIYKHLTPTE